MTEERSLGATQDLGETVVYVNPCSGSGRALGVWRRLEQRHPELSRVRLVLAADPIAARVELELQLSAKPRRVIAVGGDGTAHLVASSLLAGGLGRDIALGLLPAGTGSDLARCLALPRQPSAALRRALTARPRPLDAIQVRSDLGVVRYAINIASVGVSGAIGQAVNRLETRGRATYLLATLRILAGYRPQHCRVEIDGELLFDGPFWCVALANGRYFGQGMKIAPQAQVADGQLDLVVVPPLPAWQLPWRLGQLYRGAHLSVPGVLSRRGSVVRITPSAPLPPFDLDGESEPSGPATFEVLPQALQLLA